MQATVIPAIPMILRATVMAASASASLGRFWSGSLEWETTWKSVNL